MTTLKMNAKHTEGRELFLVSSSKAKASGIIRKTSSNKPAIYRIILGTLK